MTGSTRTEEDVETEEQTQQKMKKTTKASDLIIGQLLFVKDHCKGTFDPTYVFDHRVSGILNDTTVVLTSPDGKKKKCNIHHIKSITTVVAATDAFDQFQDSLQKRPCGTAQQQYNLGSKVKLLTIFF